MKARTRNKVISLERRNEIRSVAQTIRSGMIYQSLMFDAREVKNKEKEGYFGLVYSIPSEEPPDHLLTRDPHESQVLLMINEEDDWDLPPANGSEVERYEIYDMDTDDVHVMYRVPYKPVTLKAVKTDPTPKKI